MLSHLKIDIPSLVKFIIKQNIYVPIVSYQKGSLVDYEDCVSNVLFFKHCNMNCLYCYNLKTLQQQTPFDEQQLKHVMLDIILDEAKGIVLTGGEPTINSNLLDLLKVFRYTSNKFIKLDTNGSNPAIIQEIIDNNLVDAIAMDIKCKFENYYKLCDYSNISNLYKTVDILNKATNIKVIYRAVVGEWLTKEDILFITKSFPNIKLMPYRRM